MAYGPAGGGEVFRVLVQHLSPPQRAVLVLRDVLGFSVPETVVLMRASEVSLKTTLYLARPALETCLKTAQGEDRGKDVTGLNRVLAAAYLDGDLPRLVRLLVPRSSASAPTCTARAAAHEATARTVCTMPGKAVKGENLVPGEKRRTLRPLAFACRRVLNGWRRQFPERSAVLVS